jgi:hypothetical protein
MNCCDEFGNCTQGRDCPIRRQMTEQPTPPSKKKDVVVWILVGVVFFCMVAIGLIMRLK